MQNRHRTWNLILWAAVIVALSCSGPAQRSVCAQNPVAGWAERDDYEVRAPKIAPSKARASVARNLKDGKFESPEEEQDFVTYYEKSLFPNITDKSNRLSPRDDVVAKLRADLNNCEKREEQQVFNKLADLIVDYMGEVAGNSHVHPAARVNAMLALGEVNSLRAAKALLDAAGKERVFALRVAAMTGLVRMAGTPNGKRVLSNEAIQSSLIKNMVTYASFTKTKNDGIFWMRGQAAEVLGELGEVGSGDQVAKGLLTMLKDKNLPIPLRSKAARALGKLKYGDSPPAPREYLSALAELASDALGGDQPADRGRARLIARDVTEGMKPFAASGDQALIKGLQQTLQDFSKATADKLTAEDLKAAIEKAKEALDGLLNK